MDGCKCPPKLSPRSLGLGTKILKKIKKKGKKIFLMKTFAPLLLIITDGHYQVIANY